MTEATTVAPAESAASVVDDNTVVFHIDNQPITAAEARNGFMRNRDYTQKNQQLSKTRTELEESAKVVAHLERDPRTAVSGFIDYFNLSPADLGFNAPSQGEVVVDGEFQPAPQSNQAIAELEARVSANEQQRVTEQLNADLAAIVERDPTVDPQLLVQRTMDEGLSNFEQTYKIMLGEGSVGPLSAAANSEPEAAPGAAVIDPNVIAEKRENAGLVAEGDGAAAAATVDTAPTKYASPKDAVIATLAQLEAAGALGEQ